MEPDREGDGVELRAALLEDLAAGMDPDPRPQRRRDAVLAAVLAAGLAIVPSATSTMAQQANVNYIYDTLGRLVFGIDQQGGGGAAATASAVSGVSVNGWCASGGFAIDGGGLVGGPGGGVTVMPDRTAPVKLDSKFGGYILGAAISRLGWIPGGFYSNAKSFSQLEGEFETVLLTAGFFTIQIDHSLDGQNVYVVSLAPGFGGVLAAYKTFTPRSLTWDAPGGVGRCGGGKPSKSQQ